MRSRIKTLFAAAALVAAAVGVTMGVAGDNAPSAAAVVDGNSLCC